MISPALLKTRIFLPALLSATALLLSACDDAQPRAGATAPGAAPPVTTGAPPPLAPPPLAVPPPDLPDSALPSAAAPPRNLDVSVLHMGRLVVALERTAMRDVQHEIGAGVFDEQGDGGDFRTWLCYTTPHQQRVWLISSQTGSGMFVNSFVLERDASAEATDHCPALPAAYTPVVLEPDLHLGTPQHQVEHLFGDPQGGADAWKTYSRTESSNHDSLHFDIAHWLAVKYDNGAISAIAARKTTSN